MNIFVDEQHRLRSGWRFVIYFLGTFVVSSILAAAAALVLFLAYGQNRAEQMFGDRPGFIIQGVVLVLASFFVGWACVALFEKLKAASLGWAMHSGWLRDLLVGSALGILTLGLAAAIAGVVGGYKPVFTTNLAAAFPSLLLALVIFVIAAAGEEALFRGYGLQTMARANLAALGIALTSLPFAFVHLNNPNVSFWFTFSNTILAGVWLGLAYLKTRSLWFALGIHWSWNWTMGAVLGIPVSGVTKVAPEPLMHLQYNGPAWLNGGSYGLEGGLACTIALVVSTLLIWKLPFPKASEEMLEASPLAEAADQKWDDPNRR